MQIRNTNITVLASLVLLFFFSPVQAAVNAVDAPVLHPSIPLLDEEGHHVLDSGRPYSSKMSCGTAGCHDYESITRAFHIEQGRDETHDDFGAMRGLPHLVGPGYFGGYNCMGGSNPESLAKKTNATADDFGDLGSPDYIKRCITCHAGGGWMEKDRNGKRYDETDITTVPMLDGDYYSRNTNAGTDSHDGHDHSDHDMGGIAAWDWKKSGVVENDCLICHYDLRDLKVFDPKLDVEGASGALDQFRNLRNTMLGGQGLFRYVNTAILEFINLKHEKGEQEDKSLVTFERITDLPADDHSHSHGSTTPAYMLAKNYEDQPLLNWNAAAFDENRKVAIPMVRFPDNENCMNCHRTSNSRRGFYGFGEGAEATYDEDDETLIEDYQDDVHKGKTWVEPNGEERAIENCNACHARNYFKPAHSNVDLDASHNFLKGNSDMDVRNDLDYAPNARSCEYCHNDAPNPSIPSGHDDILSAHLERWKASGDMAGYPQSTLTRITQTHLDVVSCQACHITGKKNRGQPLLPMYRYRAAENGDLKIVPYSPRLRYYWKDKNSGRVMTKVERDSVFEKRTDASGQSYGAIIDPETDIVLGSVKINVGMHGESFADPADYETFRALKQAFDKLLAGKGVEKPDAVMVWTESNQYLMSHNTRPAVASVQCEECHSRKQDGSFSALISAEGLFGEANRKTVTQLVDRRLVDEGLVIFDFPYMKVDNSGLVTENVADILYASKVDPSMSILRAESAGVASGAVTRMAASEALSAAGITNATPAELFPSGEVYLFKSKYGSSAVRAVALMPEANGQTELVFPTYQMQVVLAGIDVVAAATDAGLGGLVSEVFSLQATDRNGNKVSGFSGNRVLVKLPYNGSNTDLEQVKVIHSTDGSTWTAISRDDVVTLQPYSNEAGMGREGYVAFWADHFSDYAVVDSSRIVTDGSSQELDSDSSGGGGALDHFLLLIGLIVMGVARWSPRRTVNPSQMRRV